MSMPLRTLAVLALAVTVARSGHAQAVELAPFVAYRVGGGFDDFQGRSYDIKDNMGFGGTIDFDLGGYGGSFLFSHQDSDVRSPALSGTGTFDIKINDWMLGGWREFGMGESKLRPIATGYIGFTHFSSDEGDIESDNRFAFSIGLGGKYRTNERIGLRVDTRGYFTFTNGNAGAFCSAPGGCALGFSGDVLFQADLAASVIVRLGGSQHRGP